MLQTVARAWFGAAHSDAFQGVTVNLGYGSFLPLMLGSRFCGLCSLHSLQYLHSFIYTFVLQLEATVSILTRSISFYC